MLNVKIFGTPPNDNALWVVADSGQSSSSFLFDCGADVLRDVSHGDVQAIDHLFLSHMHMDHISGFDAFFRVNFGRTNRPNHIWGPAGSARILSHRFQGYWWSHAAELTGTWFVHDIDETTIHTWRFEAREAFAVMHDQGVQSYDGTILETREARVAAIPLKHHGLCLGYAVREVERQSVDAAALAALGLRPGPWLASLKTQAQGILTIGDTAYDVADLRRRIMTPVPGDSVAYLTDFLADEDQRARIAPYLRGINTLYAEAQYAVEDGALALKYHHSTVDQIAALAKQAGVNRYTLLHLSRRYTREDWVAMLKTAQAVFPNSGYVAEWGIGVG
jgi:ribonuclease Z